MNDLWWSRADRLRWELDQLESAGIQYEDPGELDHPGVLTLRVQMSINGEKTALEVDFPELYPYFRCEVRSAGLTLPYHQNPISGSLCLIGRNTDNWDVGDSLRWLLEERIPLVLLAANAESAGEAEDVEEHQAEPFSDYYPYDSDDLILVPDEWELPATFERGRIEIAYSIPHGDKEPFRGAVLSVQETDGTPLLTAPDYLRRYFPDSITGDLRRLGAPLATGDAEVFQREVRIGRPGRWEGTAQSKRSVLGAVFPEEASWREGPASGQGWVFVVGVKPKPNRDPHEYFRFVRAGRTGEKAHLERIPELRMLRHHTVSVVGLGCLGAPSVLEFARAGVKELRLLDRDYLDPAAASRWPLGLAQAGQSKVGALCAFLLANYPLTKASGIAHNLGRTAGDQEALAEIADGATLIYDATAELGVSYFLSEWARRAGIPYVAVSGTQGGWGGQAVRILPGRTGCWHCLRERQRDQIPPPPHDPKAMVQPQGCADPTFTGAGFDMSSIALGGVRLAISTLLEGDDGYPRTEHDILVMSLRDHDGNLLGPTTEGFRLDRVPGCPLCSERSG